MAPANVEVRGARRVAGLGDELTREPEIQVVVRQTHPSRARVCLGLVSRKPRDLRRGVSGKEQVPGELQDAALATQAASQVLALARGGRVVPELCRTDRPIALVQTHEAVLLTGHADPRDVESLVTHRIADRDAQGLDPPGRILLARPVVALDDLVGRAPHRDDLAARRIAKHDFGRLRAAVDAEKNAAHPATAPRSNAARGPMRPCRRSNRVSGR